MFFGVSLLLCHFWFLFVFFFFFLSSCSSSLLLFFWVLSQDTVVTKKTIILYGRWEETRMRWKHLCSLCVLCVFFFFVSSCLLDCQVKFRSGIVAGTMDFFSFQCAPIEDGACTTSMLNEEGDGLIDVSGEKKKWCQDRGGMYTAHRGTYVDTISYQTKNLRGCKYTNNAYLLCVQHVQLGVCVSEIWSEPVSDPVRSNVGGIIAQASRIRVKCRCKGLYIDEDDRPSAWPAAEFMGPGITIFWKKKKMMWKKKSQWLFFLFFNAMCKKTNCIEKNFSSWIKEIKKHIWKWRICILNQKNCELKFSLFSPIKGIIPY